MDLNKQELLPERNKIGQADQDRISELPDSLLHDILSYLDIEHVARTAILSIRWNHVWTSIPSLRFPCWYISEPPSLSEINKFMDFVDTTLQRHDASKIQKFYLDTNNEHFYASRVHSWISDITCRGVQELTLQLYPEKPAVSVPVSLFTCESLIKLDLSASSPRARTVKLPTSFSCPNLKSLTLSSIQFTDEQHLSNCPVLEHLSLYNCTWFGVRSFCISTPTLKRLCMYTTRYGVDGLDNCALTIRAPNLVSLTYCCCAAKEYVLSSFQTLEFAKLLIVPDFVLREQQHTVSKFFRALSHIRSLTTNNKTLQALPIANMLPTFQNLEELTLRDQETMGRSLFPLLKAAPNLARLEFDKFQFFWANENEEDSWDGHLLPAGCLFQHLRSVRFLYFFGDAREMRWLQLILKNARALQTISIRFHNRTDANRKEELMSELLSLPKATDGFVLELL